ncbi:MAG: OmpA family protein [Acidobacteria bacterium]|nr:OmpA family protein [Acidobacteriota bacterium]
MREIKLGEDEPGCKDSMLFPRIAGCSILQCDTRDSATLEIQTGASQDGTPQQEVLEGPAEILYYLCPAKITLPSVVKQADAFLTRLGFKIVYKGRDPEEFPIVTAAKGDQWLQVSTYPYNIYSAYVLTAIRDTSDAERNADALAEEMSASGRIVISRLEFEPGKTDLPADAGAVLAGLRAFLARQPALRVRIEAHTDGTGDKAANLELSRARASALAAWLLANGVDQSRISTMGLGDTKPIADSQSEAGRVRNRRVEIVKF